MFASIMRGTYISLEETADVVFLQWTNADFHAKAGLKPKLTRYVNSEHCEWCDKLAGTYDYPVDKIIYARHENCDCVVEYHPKDGRGIQNSHTKGWR